MKLNILLFGGRGASSSTGNNSTWNKLKKLGQSVGRYSEEGIHQVQIDGEEARRYMENLPFKEWYETTPEQLDKEPIALVIYSNGSPYMNIYKNRNDLMKSVIKEYGGFKEFGNGPKIIMNMNNEYFLTRDKYAKGGWAWKDANGLKVKGSQSRNIGSRRRK